MKFLRKFFPNFYFNIQFKTPEFTNNNLQKVESFEKPLFLPNLGVRLKF